MREILFRGKRKDNGKWIEGAYLHLNVGRDYVCEGSVWIGTLQPYKEEVISETVGQYTGLTDKNGKKIFEGDIVRTSIPLSTDKYKNGVVMFGEYETMYHSGFIGFYVDWDFSQNLAVYCKMNDIEVIGNIHDNPELLKGSE